MNYSEEYSENPPEKILLPVSSRRKESYSEIVVAVVESKLFNNFWIYSGSKVPSSNYEISLLVIHYSDEATLTVRIQYYKLLYWTILLFM